jgi:hypothetical protein
MMSTSILSRCAQQLRHTAHMLEPALAARIRGEVFHRSIELVAAEPLALAYLANQLLQRIALSPSAVQRGHSNVTVDQARGTATFALDLHTWSNPLGMFTLPLASPQAQELLRTVDQNLAGPMFAAAAEYRESFPAYQLRYGQARRDAYAACESLRMSIVADLRATARRQMTAEEEAQLAEAYERAMAPSREALSAMEARNQALLAAALPGFNGSYTECLAAFLDQHLAPAVAIAMEAWQGEEELAEECSGHEALRER